MLPQKYCGDFPVGYKINTPSITVTETHIVNWACLTMDFNPLHIDNEYASRTEFQERIAHGPLIFALSIGLVASTGEAGNGVLAWLGVENMKMKSPVFIGDTINVVVEVLRKKDTRKEDRSVHTWQYQVNNHKGVNVLMFDFLIMMRCRGAKDNAK